MKEYKLIKEYPERKIGDIAVYDGYHYYWKETNVLIEPLFFDNGWFEEITPKFKVGDWVAVFYEDKAYWVSQISYITDITYEFTDGNAFSHGNIDNPDNCRLATIEEIYNHLKEEYKINDCIYYGDNILKISLIHEDKIACIDPLSSRTYFDINQNMPVIRICKEINNHFAIIGKTEDGIDIRLGDNVHVITDNFRLFMNIGVNEINKDFKYFNDENKAKEYIENNKIVFLTRDSTTLKNNDICYEIVMYRTGSYIRDRKINEYIRNKSKNYPIIIFAIKENAENFIRNINKECIYVSADNIAINYNDILYTNNTETKYIYTTDVPNSMNINKNNIFYSYRNAKDYLIKNTPMFSLNDITKELEFHSKESAISNLLQIAENKIKTFA